MGGSANQGPAPEAGAVRSAHELLGITADADAAEITRAYWRRARRLHPDASSDPKATQQFQGLNAAYRLALDNALRRPLPTAPHGGQNGTRATAGPVTFGAGSSAHSDGVWVVAGPVRVRPSGHSETTRTSGKARP